MFEEMFSSGLLNLVYFAIVAVSFLFALISLIGAELGDVLHFDFSADHHGAFDSISISPFALATFGAVFGLAGLLTRLWLGMSPIPSLLLATAAGFAVGALAQVFFITILARSTSSHFSLAEDAIGREAEVIISIPSSGQGRIAFDNVSGRVTLGARTEGGQALWLGQTVVIERVIGRTAVVRPADKQSVPYGTKELS